MFKRNIVKLLSTILAITMVLCSAPLSGFVDLKFPDFNLLKLFDFSVNTEAETYTSGIYTYTVKNGKATITDCDTSVSGALSIPSTLDGYPVTTIDYATFLDCTNLTSVTITDSVISIGPSAFYGCTSLSEIIVDQNNTNYSSDEYGVLYNKDKTTLCKYPIGNTRTSFTVPDTVIDIGVSSFEDCDNLTTVFIPDSVKNIDVWAFCNCDKLTTVTLSDGLLNVGDSAFLNCKNLISIEIPDNVTSIGDSAFENCTSLSSVSLPDGITNIGYHMFYNCVSLTSLLIPDSVKNIGDSALYNCYSIEELTMPASLGAGYDKKAFYNCSNINKITLTKGTGEMRDYEMSAYLNMPWYISRNSLREIIIEEGVSKIGSYAFFCCEKLMTITIPKSVIEIGKYAFTDCTSLAQVYYTGDIASWCGITFSEPSSNPMHKAKNFHINKTLIKEIVIPNTVNEIKNYAFYSFEGITSVDIPDSVIRIGDNAFGYCTNLTSIEIPNSVTKIGSYAFYNCESLMSITIPNSITSIGSRAFNSCISLTSITIPDSVASIGVSAFLNCTKLTSVVIGDGITSIEEDTFKYCGNLKMITIPETIEVVYRNSFDGCDSIESVYYNGSELKWEEIIIYDGNEYLTAGKLHFLNNHIHSYTEKIIKVATCSSKGERIMICSCGFAYTEVIPRLPHTEGEWKTIKTPTCTEKGTEEATCTVCGSIASTRDIEKLPHTHGLSVEENRVDPTCTTEGSLDIVIYCSVCEAEVSRETTVISPISHPKADEVEENRIKPTCTETGSYDLVVYCTVCREELSRETTIISATGHQWGDWKITTEPTMTTDGVKERECSLCGKTETEVVAKTGITVTLTDANDTIVSEKVVDGNLTAYTFSGFEDGKYTVIVAKATYATREYIITITDGEAICEFKLNHVGDINGDGKVTVLDYTQLLRHVKKTSSLEGYAFDCADVNGDGKLSVLDYTKLLRHVKKTEMLW